MELPEELHNLEQELLSGGPARPAPELRATVLRTVRRELGRTSSRRVLRGSFWGFAAAAAAAALLWANFSVSAANNTDCPPTSREARPNIRDTARRIRELLPEMTEDESIRHALLLPASSPLTVSADATHSANHDSPPHKEGV